jgi:phosphoribosyl-AMP cyclohydrolase
MKQIKINELDFNKGNGLIPVIIQDNVTKEVLMMAYTNREALEQTIKSKICHYWSRSRKKLWKKGETSGDIQKLDKILVDCDNDTLLFIVNQKGHACHTGLKSCFHNKLKI